MFKYRSRCRFTILIALEDKIIEIFPGQEIFLVHEIEYPSLELIEPEEQRIEIKPIRKRIKEAWQEQSVPVE